MIVEALWIYHPLADHESQLSSAAKSDRGQRHANYSNSNCSRPEGVSNADTSEAWLQSGGNLA
jgi:hypothetical protein